MPLKQFLEPADLYIDFLDSIDLSHIARYLKAREIPVRYPRNSAKKLVSPNKDGLLKYIDDLLSQKPYLSCSLISEIDTISNVIETPDLERVITAGSVIIGSVGNKHYVVDITPDASKPDTYSYLRYKCGDNDLFLPLAYVRNPSTFTIDVNLAYAHYSLKEEDSIASSVYIYFTLLSRSSFSFNIAYYDPNWNEHVVGVTSDREYIYSEPIEGPLEIVWVSYLVESDQDLALEINIGSLLDRPIISLKRYERARIAIKKPRVYIV